MVKDHFIEFLKEQMLAVLPKKLQNHKLRNPQTKDDFYSIICSRACLTETSRDVQQAFNELFMEV